MLKLFSLNLNGYGTKHGTWTERRSLIIENIRACDPDVLALQAVRHEPAQDDLNQAAQLAKTLRDYEHILFVPKTTGDGWEEGSAILSRTPFLAQDQLILKTSSSEDSAVRAVLYVRVKSSSDHEIGIFTCHFSWVADQNKQNLKDALPFFNRFSTDAAIIGDFNAEPDSDGVRQILSAGFVDAWRDLYPDLAEEGFTFESDSPQKRLDFALVSRSLQSSLQDLELVGLESEKSAVRMSDHLGLLLTLAR